MCSSLARRGTRGGTSGRYSGSHVERRRGLAPRKTGRRCCRTVERAEQHADAARRRPAEVGRPPDTRSRQRATRRRRSPDRREELRDGLGGRVARPVVFSVYTPPGSTARDPRAARATERRRCPPRTVTVGHEKIRARRAAPWPDHLLPPAGPTPTTADEQLEAPAPPQRASPTASSPA